ncbi:hypothetical protein ElyMa_005311300 [Elysia marginata]|uniref:Uncharacterized protein n=1 Tax=Elysia marginata TaxID=1093978 RepID=A0AAV4JYH8_9GAST|nr:hypothetical protein ElyMa_005311300 [Elysia marginata]
MIGFWEQVSISVVEITSILGSQVYRGMTLHSNGYRYRRVAMSSEAIVAPMALQDKRSNRNRPWILGLSCGP